MQNKKLKVASIVALSLVALSILFTFLLMVLGVYGDSIKALESSGDPSQNLGDGIGHGCATVIIAMFIIFALLVKLVSLIVGLSSCLAKKKIASIVTAAVFACVLAVISAVFGIINVISYIDLAANNIQATLIFVALILAPLTDLLWLAVAISRAVILSKEAKLLKTEGSDGRCQDVTDGIITVSGDKSGEKSEADGE